MTFNITVPAGPRVMVAASLSVQGMVCYYDGHDLPPGAPADFISGWNRAKAYMPIRPSDLDRHRCSVITNHSSTGRPWRQCLRGVAVDGMCFQHARMFYAEQKADAK